MSGAFINRKTIEIPEICRVEGHSAVHVEIVDNKVEKVELEVFEGTRFFEKIVLGHKFYEIPHISSRVCAICSTGHVLAAVNSLESICNSVQTPAVAKFRHLLHLGMVIESHATHICALALPDFVGAKTIYDLATNNAKEFSTWIALRKFGGAIQTAVGGRPFHPVNVQVGGLSSFPTKAVLQELLIPLEDCRQKAIDLCELLLSIKIPKTRISQPVFVALIPEEKSYSFFGKKVRSSDGWEADINDYKNYLQEKSVSYSHAKRSFMKGKTGMVGSMARLHLFGSYLKPLAASIYQSTALAKGDVNTILNNLAQAIEIVESIDQREEIIKWALTDVAAYSKEQSLTSLQPKAGMAAGAVECPRGTLYHWYEMDSEGKITKADMVTPSAQNSACIEQDIKELVENTNTHQTNIETSLETLIRAYDPCNTCATHMVSVNYR